ncbi:hypothetical protein GOV10_04510 [Candidatus Woesearchaeota archaeon]|nr:hypothetical protein [Candidatus Woesearchaeota archaeon]
MIHQIRTHDVAIHVCKSENGVHYATRTYSRRKQFNPESRISNRIFTLTQELNESDSDFTSRAKKAARERGIDHVEKLD